LKTTSLYDRLPSIAGVHFGGFENIKIESRENVTRFYNRVVTKLQSYKNQPSLKYVQV